MTCKRNWKLGCWANQKTWRPAELLRLLAQRRGTDQQKQAGSRQGLKALSDPGAVAQLRCRAAPRVQPQEGVQRPVADPRQTQPGAASAGTVCVDLVIHGAIRCCR